MNHQNANDGRKVELLFGQLQCRPQMKPRAPVTCGKPSPALGSPSSASALFTPPLCTWRVHLQVTHMHFGERRRHVCLECEFAEGSLMLFGPGLANICATVVSWGHSRIHVVLRRVVEQRRGSPSERRRREATVRAPRAPTGPAWAWRFSKEGKL